MAAGRSHSDIVIGLTAVAIAVTAGKPRVLTVRRLRHRLGASRGSAKEVLPALPFGPFAPVRHRTLELGVRAWVEAQTNLTLGYVEQLYTFADRDREVPTSRRRPRVASIGYLALVREAKPAGKGHAQWQDWYDYFPWEDGRNGRSPLINRVIVPRLAKWAQSVRDLEERRRRDERLRMAFGLAPARWDEERVLERYELLYEAGLVAEAQRPARGASARGQAVAGQPMVFDHRRILATAMSRLRGKLKYRPLVFELMPPGFTLLQLQQTVEALAGVALHKQNFRRLVEHGGLVERIGVWERGTGGRPAEKFRFRRDVLMERPAPGVGLPARRR